jgi:hypothetical protein
MKKLLIVLLLATNSVWAHDHVEVGEDPADRSRLGFDGPGFQLAMYVPPGEPFSGYLPYFPGGWHACELTFTTEVNALDPALDANPRIELISIAGPTGGTFCFWEVGETSPTWCKPTGWTNHPGNTATFDVIYGGENHVHGRAFTMDVPGEYTVVFRAVDSEGNYLDSATKTISFVAQLPPPLSMQIENGAVQLSFISRLNLDYDLQSCTDLHAGVWVNQTVVFGDGTEKSHTTSASGYPGQFYRLVEY